MSSGFSGPDAQNDFSRARRARLLTEIARRLRREPDDVGLILPFEEVVEALGRTGQVDRGLQVVRLEDIVGTVDRAADFDVVLQELLGVLAPLSEALAAIREPGSALFHDPLFDRQIQQVALARDPFAVHDVELRFAEWWRHLVLHDLDARAAADDLIAVLDAGDAPDVDADRRV